MSDRCVLTQVHSFERRTFQDNVDKLWRVLNMGPIRPIGDNPFFICNACKQTLTEITCF